MKSSALCQFLDLGNMAQLNLDGTSRSIAACGVAGKLCSTYVEFPKKSRNQIMRGFLQRSRSPAGVASLKKPELFCVPTYHIIAFEVYYFTYLLYT